MYFFFATRFDRNKAVFFCLAQHLDWTINMNQLHSKLNRAIGLLSKIGHYFPKFILRTLYYTSFNSHLIYACQILGQDPIYLRKLSIPQNKAIRIINVKNYDYPVNEFYHENKILKIEDYIKLLNCLLKMCSKTTSKYLISTLTKLRKYTTRLQDTRHTIL